MSAETGFTAPWTADLDALGFRLVDEAADDMPDLVDSQVRITLTRHPAVKGMRPVEFEASQPIRCACIFEREAENYSAGPINVAAYSNAKRKALLAMAALFRLRAKHPAEDDEVARSHFIRLRNEAKTYLHIAACIAAREADHAT